MLKPYSGQIEQEHNAIEAERLGLAIHASTISSALVETLLKQEKPVAKAYTDITPAFVSWLETGAHDLDESTYLKLWGNVSRETNAIPYQNNLKP